MQGGGDFDPIFNGALAENFVLCERISSYGGGMHYDHWRNKNGIAEIDFLLQDGSDIIPIDVKSGKIPRLRGLESY